jgi:lipid A disaccharide synthetase
MDLMFGLEDMSLMGISEFIPKLGRAWHVLRVLAPAIEKQRPSALVLIDLS